MPTKKQRDRKRKEAKAKKKPKSGTLYEIFKQEDAAKKSKKKAAKKAKPKETSVTPNVDADVPDESA